jgi:hypothetical protein
MKDNTLDVLGLSNPFESTPSRFPYCCSKAIGKHIMMVSYPCYYCFPMVSCYY